MVFGPTGPNQRLIAGLVLAACKRRLYAVVAVARRWDV